MLLGAGGALASEFAAALERLLSAGVPNLALGVSGGADSTALALLAHDYCAQRGGRVLALIVDHGLRAESADEAKLTAGRLQGRGIPSRVLTLSLAAGAATQERARAARYAALAQAVAGEGLLYLALGHHRADQEETVAMRALRGPGGGEGMAGWAARNEMVLLRPLLGIQPAILRDFLREQGMEWAEDPSNQARKFERVRIRQDHQGLPPQPAEARIAKEEGIAAFLARHAELRPEGFALLDAPSCPPEALGALLRCVGGKSYAPRQDALLRLCQELRPATLGGVRISPAGRLGPGWLLAREPAGCAPAIAAVQGAVWDGRFTLQQAQPGAVLGALGADAAAFRSFNGLPALVLRGLPALRLGQRELRFPAPARFTPPMPATARPFSA